MIPSMSPSSTKDFDRFIPLRSEKNVHPDASLFSQISSKQTSYAEQLKKNLFGHVSQKVISFSQKQSTSNYEIKVPQTSTECSSIQNKRVYSPTKILDIPQYKDDFYLNTLDWSRQGHIGIALDNEAYIYTPQNTVNICKAPFSSYISSVRFWSNLFIVGLSNGLVEIYDIEKQCMIRGLFQHKERVSSLTYLNNNLITGSKDKSIQVHDLREKDHLVNSLIKHKGEICSLKQKNQSQMVLASGSNDGSAIVWDLRFGSVIKKYGGQKGAIKALGWCPWKNGTLAFGGGISKNIQVYNTHTNSLLASQKVQSQISGLLWNQNQNSLITSHGFSDNSIKFWKLDQNPDQDTLRPDLNRKLILTENFEAHNGRILNMCQSRDKNFICSASSDQTLKFWCLQESKKNEDPFHQCETPEKKSFYNSRIL